MFICVHSMAEQISSEARQRVITFFFFGCVQPVGTTHRHINSFRHKGSGKILDHNIMECVSNVYNIILNARICRLKNNLNIMRMKFSPHDDKLFYLSATDCHSIELRLCTKCRVGRHMPEAL